MLSHTGDKTYSMKTFFLLNRVENFKPEVKHYIVVYFTHCFKHKITFNIKGASHITVRSKLVVSLNQVAQKTQHRKQVKFAFLKN